MPTVAGISFDRVTDAADHVSPGDDITGFLRSNAGSGSLIEVPPGRYIVDGSVSFGGLNRVGIRGTGSSPRDVTFTPRPGRAFRMLRSGGGSVGSMLLENVSFDERDDASTAVTCRFVTSGGSVFRNIEYLGQTPDDSADGFQFSVDVSRRDGVAVIENLVMGRDQWATEESYPNGRHGIWSGGSHRGELIVRNCHLEGRNSAAMRSTGGPGVYTVEGGAWINNQNSSIRVSPGDHPSKTTTVRGTYALMDMGRTSTSDLVRLDTHTGSKTVGGTVYENVVLEWLQNGGQVIQAPDWGDHGRATFRNCVIRNEVPGVNVITAERPSTGGSGNGIVFENCDFTGSGGGFYSERSGSVIRDSCIGMPNASIQGFQTQNISSGGCRVPDGAPQPEPMCEGAGDCPGTAECVNGTCVYPTPTDHTLVIKGDGAITRYTFSVSGHVEAAGSGDLAGGDYDTVRRFDDGTERVDGVTGDRPGTGDTWVLDGVIDSFEFTDGSGVLEFDGETVDPSAFPLPDDPTDGDGGGTDDGSDGDDTGDGGSEPVPEDQSLVVPLAIGYAAYRVIFDDS